MKKTFYYILSALTIAAGNTACSEDDGYADTVAPGQITNVRFTPNYGGGYFLYDIPDDDDFLYVRADYVVDSGEKISKTCSTYGDTLFIEGFGQMKEYEVKLYSIDRSENASEPVIQYVTPLESNTNMVASTITVRPGFSSLIAEWTNELEQTVDVFVRLDDGNKTVEKVLSSNSKEGFFMVENLQNVDYQVSVYTKDQYGNTSHHPVLPAGIHGQLYQRQPEERSGQCLRRTYREVLGRHPVHQESGEPEHLQYRRVGVSLFLFHRLGTDSQRKPGALPPAYERCLRQRKRADLPVVDQRRQGPRGRHHGLGAGKHIHHREACRPI